jgi:hypothetical protein
MIIKNKKTVEISSQYMEECKPVRNKRIDSFLRYMRKLNSNSFKITANFLFLILIKKQSSRKSSQN